MVHLQRASMPFEFLSRKTSDNLTLIPYFVVFVEILQLTNIFFSKLQKDDARHLQLLSYQNTWRWVSYQSCIFLLKLVQLYLFAPSTLNSIGHPIGWTRSTFSGILESRAHLWLYIARCNDSFSLHSKPTCFFILREINSIFSFFFFSRVTSGLFTVGIAEKVAKILMVSSYFV